MNEEAIDKIKILNMDLEESQAKYKDLKKKLLNLTSINASLEKELDSSKNEVNSLLMTIQNLKKEETPKEECVQLYSQKDVPCSDLCKYYL
jgi:predicted nuclease with TOPRIM domain